MSGAEVLATIPEWVAPTHDEVMDVLRVLNGAADGDHGAGQEAAARWATDIVWSSPMSCRGGERPVTWTEARAECWMAACAAAGADPPTAQEWRLLDAAPRETVASDPDYAHGAWYVLAWLLGERNDPPQPPGPAGDGPPETKPQRLARQRAEAAQRCTQVRERIAAR